MSLIVAAILIMLPVLIWIAKPNGWIECKCVLLFSYFSRTEIETHQELGIADNKRDIHDKSSPHKTIEQREKKEELGSKSESISDQQFNLSFSYEYSPLRIATIDVSRFLSENPTALEIEFFQTAVNDVAVTNGIDLVLDKRKGRAHEDTFVIFASENYSIDSLIEEQIQRKEDTILFADRIEEANQSSYSTSGSEDSLRE